MIKTFDKKLVIILSVFLLAVLIYFLPIPIKFKICLPLAVLAIASLFTLPWQMCACFWTACIGDLFSGLGNFEAQLICFTLSLIFLIFFLLVQFNGIDPKSKQQIIALIACLLVFNSAMFLIVPYTPMGMVRTTVIIYSIVVAFMLYFGIMQWNGVLIIAVTLFLFSNYALGWNKFVNSFPNSNFIIMISYYIAQGLFFIGAYQNTKKWKLFKQLRREAQLAAAANKQK